MYITLSQQTKTTLDRFFKKKIIYDCNVSHAFYNVLMACTVKLDLEFLYFRPTVTYEK